MGIPPGIIMAQDGAAPADMVGARVLYPVVVYVLPVRAALDHRGRFHLPVSSGRVTGGQVGLV